MPAPASALVAALLGDDAFVRRLGLIAMYVAKSVNTANGGQIAGDAATPSAGDAAVRAAFAKKIITGNFSVQNVGRFICLEAGVLGVVSSTPNDAANSITDAALIAAMQSSFTALANAGV